MGRQSNGKVSFEEMQRRSDAIREKHQRYRANKKTHAIDRTAEIAPGVYHQTHFAPFAGGPDGEPDAPTPSDVLTVVDGVPPTWAERVQRMADRIARGEAPWHPDDTTLFDYQRGGGPRADIMPTEMRKRSRSLSMREDHATRYIRPPKNAIEDI